MTSNLNSGLSLLSRGIGEERRRAGHRKLEVCLEPEDYHNITPRKFYLPPLHQHAWPSTPAFPRQISTHKTFTTRKGALLLYAEDLALTTCEAQPVGKTTTKSLEAEDTSLFNTFDDLRSAILSYGAKESRPQIGDDDGNVYLGFVHSRRSFNAPRTIRPGFSAKRYLSSWTKSWDDSVLNDLKSKGHIWDKNPFQSHSLDSKLAYRLNDDLSRVPGPYRLTKNMLMSPGEAGSYEFYRVRAQSADSGRPSEDDSDIVNGNTSKSLPAIPLITPNPPGTIAAIIRDKQNKPHAVVYKDLDKTTQQEILQRLLMQSAIHKQQEIMETSTTLKLMSVKSQQGSRDVTPFDAVNGVNDIDIANAIEALTSKNSINLVDGEQVFDDRQLAEMYKSYFAQKSSVPSASSLKKGQPKSAQKVSFSHLSTLPPIKKSPVLRRALKPSNAQLPDIDMKPLAPRPPKASLTASRVSSYRSAVESVRSSSGMWASEESNAWEADIDEDQILQEQQQLDEQQDYDGDAEDDEVTSGSKVKSVASSKHSMAGSVRVSAAGSVRDDAEETMRHSVAGSVVNHSVAGSVADSVINHSVAGSVANSVANKSVAGSVKLSVGGSVKQSDAGSVQLSISGSVKQSVAGSANLSHGRSSKRSLKPSSKTGSAISLGNASLLLDTQPLSRSLDSLSMAGSEPLALGLMGSIKGGSVPKNRAEAMRSYKGSSRSRHNSGGSSGFDSDTDVLMIGSVNKGGASSKASVGSTQDLHQEDSSQSAQPDQGVLEPVIPTLEPVIPTVQLDQVTDEIVDKPDQTEAELDQPLVEQDESSSKLVQNSVEQDQNKTELVQSPDNLVQDTPNQVESGTELDKQPSEHAESVQNEEAQDESQVSVLSDRDTAGDDLASMLSVSGKQSVEDVPDLIRVPTAEEEENQANEEPTDTGDQVAGSQGTSKPGSVQSIPIVDVGMDLPAVDEDIDNMVKSRRTQSIPSVAGSLKSSHVPQGDVDIMASFHNFSYDSANNSRKKSLESLAEDVLALDGKTSGAESETENQWPLQQTSESEQEDITATEDETTDAEKTRSRMTSGNLSIASGSVRALSASVIGLSQRATPASQLIELEEHAAAVAAAVLQGRPQSGRDLALDARIASELWTQKLSQLFVQNENPVERSRSAFVSRRRNSLDSMGSHHGDGDRVGQWMGPSFLQPKPQIKRSTRTRRVNSAKAAVRFIKELLRGDAVKGDDLETEEEEENLEELLLRAVEENEHLELAPEIQELISSRAGSIVADDIAIVEDQDQGKLIVRSRAPSAVSMQSSFRIGDVNHDGRVPSGGSVSERAISAVASENMIPSVIIQSADELDSEEEESSSDETGVTRGVSRDVSRVPSVAELHQVLAERASGDEQDQDDVAGSIHSSKPASVVDETGSVVETSPQQLAAGGSFSLDVTNIGKAEKKEGEKQPLVVRAGDTDSKPPDENTQEVKADEDAALQQIINDTGLLKKGKKSSKSSKSSKSGKSSKSSNGSKSGKNGKDKDEFVVKKTEDDKADHLLYKPLPEPEPKPSEQPAQPKGKKGGKKGNKKVAAKKTKKKKKDEPKPNAEEKPVEETTTEKVEDKTEEEKPESEAAPEDPQPLAPEEGDGEKLAEDGDEFEDEDERKSPESPEFIFIEDPEPEPPISESVAATDVDASEYMSTFTEDSTSDGLNSIDNQAAKAAKRAAEKEKRRLAVERKRQGREDARRKAIEKAELQEQLKLEYEEARQRKEDEIRMRKERKEADRLAAIHAEEEQKRQTELAKEREKEQMEKYKKKMEEVARRKREEDQKRKEEEEKRKAEEDVLRKAEEAMMAEMQEAERLEYEKRKRQEELEAQRIAEQERIRRELEARLAQAEAERLAIEIARRQKEMQRRLEFNRELQSESNVMSHSQDITKMFTWSYFELLDYLNIPIPDELKDHYEREKQSKSTAGGSTG